MDPSSQIREWLPSVLILRGLCILLTSTMLHHDVIMTSYCCQRYAECLVVTRTLCVPAGLCTGTPRRARATVELLHQETPIFLACNLWPPNSPDLSPVNYEIWAGMQRRVSSSSYHIRFWYLWCCGCPGLRGRQHLATPHTRSP